MTAITDFQISLDATVVNLSFRGICQLPDGICRLTELEALNLQGNKLSSLAGIRELRKLKHLCLDHNALTRLPEEIGELKELEYLDVSNNLLTELPESIASLPKLKYINVTYNKIREIPPALEDLVNSQQLIIDGYIPPYRFHVVVKEVWTPYNTFKWYCHVLVIIIGIIAGFYVDSPRHAVSLSLLMVLLYLHRPTPQYQVTVIHEQTAASGYCDEFKDKEMNILAACWRLENSDEYRQWLKAGESSTEEERKRARRYFRDSFILIGDNSNYL